MPLNLALVHTHIDFWVVYCWLVPIILIRLRICCVRTGEARKRQPDNFQGLKAGRSVKVSRIFLDSSPGKYSRLKVRDPSGLTVEGLQEYYDEACLAILNNRWVSRKSWMCS